MNNGLTHQPIVRLDLWYVHERFIRIFMGNQPFLKSPFSEYSKINMNIYLIGFVPDETIHSILFLLQTVQSD